MKAFLYRGVLIGSSLGVFAALAGLVDSMPRAFVLGGAAGALAGWTVWRRKKK